MKVKSATIRLVLKRNRMNRNGEFPVYIVVCFGGRVEKATGISVLERHWDRRRECVKGGSNAPVLNKMLSDIKQRVIDRKNNYEFNNRRYTAGMLLEDVIVDLSGNDSDYWNVCNRLIEERRLKDGTYRGYLYTYRKLCEYLGKKEFIVDSLTLGVVKDFSMWLEKNSIKINTIKRVLSCIAAVWNYAISRKLADVSGYPFTEFKYTSKYKEVPRDYYLEKSHIVRLRDYWLDLCIERHGKMWSYKPGVEEKLHQRWTREFGILWFLLCYKLNGSSPVDVAAIKPTDCKRVSIGGEDYWAIDIRRKKTDRPVHIRLKRDLLTIIGLEHFLGYSGHFVYPIIYWFDGMTDRQLNEQSHHNAQKAIKHVREAFLSINEEIAMDNVNNGSSEPTVDVNRVVMYTARHSFASQYLSTPGASVNGLASLMARSANTIATYVHQLTKDEEIVSMVENMPI